MTIVTIGVIRISSFVRPDTRCPSSMPTKAAMNAPSGSPGPFRVKAPPAKAAPLRMELAKAPARPATAAEIVTSGDSLNLYATPTAIPAPVRPLATLAMLTIVLPTEPPKRIPIWARIVPTISVEKRPRAIPDNPSIKTLYKKRDTIFSDLALLIV